MFNHMIIAQIHNQFIYSYEKHTKTKRFLCGIINRITVNTHCDDGWSDKHMHDVVSIRDEHDSRSSIYKRVTLTCGSGLSFSHGVNCNCFVFFYMTNICVEFEVMA